MAESRVPPVPETVAGYSYHNECPKCVGCDQQFLDTIRIEEANAGSYCLTCYGSIVGLDEYKVMHDSLNEMDLLFVSVPAKDIPKDVIRELTFVNKKMKEELLNA